MKKIIKDFKNRADLVAFMQYAHKASILMHEEENAVYDKLMSKYQAIKLVRTDKLKHSKGQSSYTTNVLCLLLSSYFGDDQQIDKLYPCNCTEFDTL